MWMKISYELVGYGNVLTSVDQRFNGISPSTLRLARFKLFFGIDSNAERFFVAERFEVEAF